jgi:uncharacterized membrane protein YadS
VGAFLIAIAVGISGWGAAQLKKRDEPTRRAWQLLLRSGNLWIGMVLLISAFSPVAAGALLVAILVVVTTFFVVLLSRGVRGLPEFWRRLRRIGDPAAWRGEPSH